MRITVSAMLAAWLLTASILVGSGSQMLLAEEKKAAPVPMKLKVGDSAPDFALKYFDGADLKDVSLSQYRGKKNVLLAFYIFAFTGG
jgi:hypothetical protein